MGKQVSSCKEVTGPLAVKAEGHQFKMFFYHPNNSFYMEVEDFDLYFLTKIDIWLELFMTLLGSGLYLVIVNYEQFGSDPMKRSILNKLISATCLGAIAGTLPSAITLFLRASLGGLDEYFAITIVFVQVFFFFFVIINVIIIFGYKDLSILAFNFVNRLEEGFWFTFLQMFNAMASLIFTSIEHFVADQSRPVAKAYAGVQIGQASYGR